jgi:hypothetical protein
MFRRSYAFIWLAKDPLLFIAFLRYSKDIVSTLIRGLYKNLAAYGTRALRTIIPTAARDRECPFAVSTIHLNYQLNKSHILVLRIRNQRRQSELFSRHFSKIGAHTCSQHPYQPHTCKTPYWGQLHPDLSTSSNLRPRTSPTRSFIVLALLRSQSLLPI